MLSAIWISVDAGSGAVRQKMVSPEAEPEAAPDAAVEAAVPVELDEEPQAVSAPTAAAAPTTVRN